VDGFITLGLQPQMRIVQLIRQRHMPFVTIDGLVDDEIPSVNINDEVAAYQGMRHILDLGHRQIWLVGLEQARMFNDPVFPGVGDWRRNGYVRACQESVWTRDISLRHLVAQASQEGGRKVAAEYLSLSPAKRPSALVFQADVMAIGAMRMLADAGIIIGSQVSILGFDDIPEASIIYPGLSTIAQPGKEIGRRAAELYFNLLFHRGGADHALFVAELKIRQSTFELV
jgi:DNA-binding LacI/PurR family transcriptional regulator